VISVDPAKARGSVSPDHLAIGDFPQALLH